MSCKVGARLLYVVHHGYPHSSDGYARGLMDQGVEVLVCTGPGEPAGDDTSPTSEGTQDCVEGVVYWHPAMRGFHGLSYADRCDAFSAMLQSKIRQFQPKALMAASNWQVALPAMDAARREGLPFYYEVRGFWEITQLSRDATYRETEEFSVHVEQETRVCLSAAGVFTLGEAMRAILVRRGVAKEKISLVPNGLRAWRPRRSIPAISKAQLGISSRHVVGYVGSFNSYEGLEDLVKAAAALRKSGLDLSVLLVGGSGVAGIVPSTGAAASCAATESLQTLAEDLDFADRLILPGRVPADQAAAYYDAMDLVVIPRKPMEVSEIVPPLKPLEALAAGKQVLMSDVAPLKELAAKEPRFRCFEKGNVESLAREMESLLSNPAPEPIQTNKSELHPWDWSEMVKPIVQIIKPAFSISSNPAIFAYDANWQYPAMTEQHAYESLKRLWMEHAGSTGYVAFPWATAIDHMQCESIQSTDWHRLLDQFADRLGKEMPALRKVTVCQHVKLKEFLHLFKSCGITDIFWSHFTINDKKSLTLGGMKLHPFPLYPVQQVSRPASDCGRNVLFSFVGAGTHDFYLTESRNWIFQHLQGMPGGVVCRRDSWHCADAVYNKQIGKALSLENHINEEDKEKEFRDLLSKSIFSLCPSGTGPNSIRLWESLGAGAIPVILADTYLPPGPLSLWEDAAVFCPETEEAIAALPAKLEAMAKDSALLEKKRRAMKCLWLKYGPDCFVYDVLKFLMENDAPAAAQSAAPGKGARRAEDSLVQRAEKVVASRLSPREAAPLVWRGLYTRGRISPEALRTLLAAHPEIVQAATLSYSFLPADTRHLARHQALRSIPGLDKLPR